MLSSPPPKPRAVKTTKIPLTYVQYVNETGLVTNRGALKWPKVDSEAGKVLCSAVFINAELKDLPAKGLAAARLVLPVVQTHKSAPCKIGVVFLKNAAEPGKAADVKELENFAGTAVIPKQPEETPVYKPAKTFAVDVTRGIKAVAAGEAKCAGFAVRIVPDRGVDEGYTVRCEISPTDPVVLEVDTYAD